jgi:DNA-binding beta-propeller fold protein YncE
MTGTLRGIFFHSLEMLLLAGLFLSPGCSSISSGSGSGIADTQTVHRIWPPAPAAPRISYFGSVSSPADLGAKLSVWRRAGNFLTGADRGLEPFVRPQAVTLDENDNLCIADPGAGAIGFFDRARKKYFRWTAAGGERFVNPVAVAKHGRIFFAADSALAKVFGFDEDGRLLLTITNHIARPAGLAASSNRLFVADSLADKILIFDQSGRLVGQFGERGTGRGMFNAPTHVALDSSGRIYVTDSLNFRVQIFDADGKFLSLAGSMGDGTGHLSRPKGVGVDAFGHIYIVDALFDNVQVFDVGGRYLMNWGEAGQDPGEFWLPSGIAVDRASRIFVADSYNKRIQVFDYVGSQ